MKILKFFTIFCLFLINQVNAQAPDTPFWQEQSEFLSLPDINVDEINQIAIDDQNQLWMLTNDGLWVMLDEEWREIHERLDIDVVPEMKIAVTPDISNIRAFVAPDMLYVSSPGARTFSFQFEFGAVNDISIAHNGDVWIAAADGLFHYSRVNSSIKKIESVKGPVLTVACQTDKVIDNARLKPTICAAASDERLYLYDGKNWRHEYVDTMVGNTIQALEFAEDGTLWIGNNDYITLLKTDGTFHRIDGEDGLPYNHITCLESAGNAMWIGTEKGAIRYHDEQWNYYNGPRWFNGSSVKSIANYDKQTYFLTESGIIKITFDEWTLSQKTRHYKSTVYPRHDRYGLVADVRIADFNQPLKYTQSDNDNDGLWTAMYLASLCFEYAVTQDPLIQKQAWYHFEALEMLEEITGIPGLIARSYVKSDQNHEGGEWHESADGRWLWKGDTSSDEAVGHFFVYPIVYDLLAETDEEKQRVTRLTQRIMDYIIRNRFNLIDVDGKPTRWGVWAPEKLNDDPQWSFERGLNSLQIISFLISTYHMTGDEKYLQVYQELVDEHGYLQNIINQKVLIPGEINHSDDELAFLPYYNLIQYADDTELKNALRLSLKRSWEIEKPEKSPLWNIIYGAYLQKTEQNSFAESETMNDALWTLREWPLDLTSWPVQNSHRLDIELKPYKSRFGYFQSKEVLPPGERWVTRWNENPYRLDSDQWKVIYDPGMWLLPYWMGRFHGFIE